MTGEKNRFKTTEKLWDLDDKQLKTPVHDAMILWLMDEDNLKQLLFKYCDKEEHTRYSSEDFELNECLDINVHYESEKPIMSSPTFIAGYADLIVNFSFTKYTSKETCPIDSEWWPRINAMNTFEGIEKLLQHYHNDPSFKAKKFAKEHDYSEAYYQELDDGTLREVPVYLIDTEEYRNTLKKFHKYDDDYRSNATLNKIADFVFNTGVGIDSITKSFLHWMEHNNKYAVEEYGVHCLIEVKPYIDSFGAVLRQIKSYQRFYKEATFVGAIKCYTKYCLFTFDDRFDKQFESQGIKVLHPWVLKADMLDMYGLR